jgi:hypothetical protein
MVVTDAEKKIYDEFESGGRALLAKAKADAAAIGADINAIIGQTEKALVKDSATVKTWFEKTWLWKAITGIFRWIAMYPLQIIDDPKGKFSHKRLLALGFGVTSIILAFHGAWISSAIYVLAAIIIAVVSVVTKT